MLEKKITFDSFIRGLLVFLGLAFIVIAVNYLSSVLIPFFVAWFVAYLIYPFVHFFQYRLHFRYRIVSILATLLLIVGIIWGACALTLPSVMEEANHFKDITINFIEKGAHNNSIPPRVQTFITEQAQNLNWKEFFSHKDLLKVIEETMPKVWNVVYETAGVIIAIVSSCIMLLYLFFILFDYEKLTTCWIRMVPKGRRQFFSTLFSDLEKGMNNYFRGQALIALCVGILFSAGFLIIGFPLAIPLGLFIGVLSFVPYLHVFGLVPALLLALLKAADTGQNFWLVLLSALVVFMVVQIIEDFVLTPRIMGRAVGLPPFLILLALSVWGYLLGIIGMIIALPLTTIIISYYKRYVIKDQTVDS